MHYEFLKDWLRVSSTSFIYDRQLHSFAMTALNGFISMRAEEIASVWGKQKASKKPEKVYCTLLAYGFCRLLIYTNFVLETKRGVGYSEGQKK